MRFEPGTYRVEQLIKAGVLDVGDGYRAKNSELSTSGLPFARAGNINDGFRFVDADRFPKSQLHKVGSKVSRPGDVVFTSKGTVGRFAFVTQHVENFVYSPQLCFWRALDSEILDPRFLFYWMQGPEFMGQVDYLKGQTDMADYVSLRDQRRMFMTLVPLSIQQEVAAILGALDDRIDLLRQTNTTLEAIAQALFKSWFIDFDPVHAKQAGREPEGMDAATAALFPAGFEESALGLIPKGWHCGCLGDILIQRVSRTKPSEVTANLAYVPIECITAKSVFLQDSLPGAQAQSSLTLFKEGDILFGAMRPYFHKVCIAPFDGVTRTTAFVLQPKAEHRAFALFAAFDDSTIEFATTHSEGSTIPYAKWSGSLERKPLVLPPSELAAAFETVVAPLLSSGIHATRWAQTLTDAREELLPRLISGKLRLPEAREQLEDALA